MEKISCRINAAEKNKEHIIQRFDTTKLLIKKALENMPHCKELMEPLL